MSINYFPFLRGKRYELSAVRDLVDRIASFRRIIPILEPFNANKETYDAINDFINESLPFLFICNPGHGTFFTNQSNIATRHRPRILGALAGYRNWTPALNINEWTGKSRLDTFIRRFGGDHPLALIYRGLPRDNGARASIANHPFRWHVFLRNAVASGYITSLDLDSCVDLDDTFRRRIPNASYPEYPPAELFTDRNTLSSHFGDFSIVGDYVAGGGPAHAVALHHIHLDENRSGALYISHFISDRRNTPIDPAGKVLEALNHLVAALPNLHPNNTEACQEYREMVQNQQGGMLGPMKYLAIKHHLEVMLNGGLL